VWRINRERAVDYLNTRNRIYVIDGFAGWDERYRINVRVVCARAYHALFMRNMLIRPSRKQLEHFHPDYTIYNAGAFPANRFTTGMTSATSVSINFAEKEMVILGTEYAGEMKKGKRFPHDVPCDFFLDLMRSHWQPRAFIALAAIVPARIREGERFYDQH
jgi:phosphoenolpyruvate carboxykinase (ATP)